eukprot:COSAG01_NODE_32094_length_586_cov_1.689938_1_plen_122_part_01
MVFPKEAAHRTVSLFGHLSKVQFIDLNEVREQASEPAAPGACGCPCAAEGGSRRSLLGLPCNALSVPPAPQDKPATQREHSAVLQRCADAERTLRTFRDLSIQYEVGDPADSPAPPMFHSSF